MRPKKKRVVRCGEIERWFRPRCIPPHELSNVFLELDEFEAIRLADKEGLHHKEAAQQMGISRPTFSRIIASARSKIATALVELKGISIKGVSCCRIVKQNKTKVRKKQRRLR